MGLVALMNCRSDGLKLNPSKSPAMNQDQLRLNKEGIKEVHEFYVCGLG